MDVVLLGHGSRRGKDTDVGLQEVERRLQGRLNGRCKVRMAGFEFTRPTLEETVTGLARQGSRSIVVMPFFLFDGKHIKIEIPDEMERLRSLLPHVSITYAHTLGLDPRLVAMVKEKADNCFALADKGNRHRGVVVVTRGTRFPYGSVDGVWQLASRLADAYGGKVGVEPAQAQFGQPTMEEAIASLVGGGAGVVAVIPYLLFPGKVLYDNIAPAVEKAETAYPYVTFRLADTIGVDDRLIDVALDRLREAGVSC